jgi:hypothetical protein
MNHMQIKTMRFHHAPIKMTKAQKDDTMKCRREWRTSGTYSLLMGRHNGSATLEDSLAAPYKNKHAFIP